MIEPPESDALTVMGYAPSRTSPSGLTIKVRHDCPVNKKTHKRRNKLKRARLRAQKNRRYEAKRRVHWQAHQTKSFSDALAV